MVKTLLGYNKFFQKNTFLRLLNINPPFLQMYIKLCGIFFKACVSKVMNQCLQV